MMRLVAIAIIYVQSVLFFRYAELMHKALLKGIEWREQLLVDPDILLFGDFCQQPSVHGAPACSFSLQHKRDDQWLKSCNADDVRQNHVARYWLLTTECRVTFLFYRQKTFLLQQKIFR